MLNATCRKSGHSSALLNVNLAFQFLECIVLYCIVLLWSQYTLNIINKISEIW